jgi:CelD/BcsL family acetyltransferase involved in cellulose biosynthesis
MKSFSTTIRLRSNRVTAASGYYGRRKSNYDRADIAFDLSDLDVSLKVTSDLNDFSDIWPRSGRLLGARCHPFQHADFLAVWCATIGRERGTKPFFIAVMNKTEQPIALLALGLESRFGIRIMSFLDGGVSDYNGPVLFPDNGCLHGQLIERIFELLERVLPKYDVLILNKMPKRVLDQGNPFVTPGTAHFWQSGYVLPVQNGWSETIERGLPRAKDMRRKRRRLEALGTMTYHVAATPEERDRFLKAMMRQKSGRYLQTRGIDGFDSPGYRAFFSSATRSFADSGLLHLSAITVDDTILAVHWGYRVEDRFYYMMPSYETSGWDRYSPGRLLLNRLIEWSANNGVRLFDQGIGDEPYKLEYCDDTIPLYSYERAQTGRGKLHIWLGQRKERWRGHPLFETLRPYVRKAKIKLKL